MNWCGNSGLIQMNRPYWVPEGEWKKGRQITCTCGKQVKLRVPPNGGIVYTMIPRHKVPK